jgi:hypothetical protein
MEEKSYVTWKDFNEQELRRCATFQLSVDDLARDLYYDEKATEKEDEVTELNFDF